MSLVSPILGLPYIQPSQAQKHVTHNEAITVLEAVVQLSVKDHTLAIPPSGPARGDRYIVPNGSAGAWGSDAGDVAVWAGSGWTFITPQTGWQAFSQTGDVTIQFDGTDWLGESGELITDTLGVNTTADAINRLSVSSDATLLSHDGAGHQLKLNKATPPDTASLLFQTNWSGRAEMGTTGTDDFAIKVSGDGAVWHTALSFDGTTGLASGDAIQSSPTDLTTGKLARADYVYSQGNVVGNVSEAAGIPTGAVIERGSNVNGDYVRFADGTQICWSPQFTADVTIAAGAIFRSGAVSWIFPASFSSTPSMTQGRQNHSTAYWTVPGVTTATVGSASALSYQSIPSRAINLMAFGRWF